MCETVSPNFFNRILDVNTELHFVISDLPKLTNWVIAMSQGHHLNSDLTLDFENLGAVQGWQLFLDFAASTASYVYLVHQLTRCPWLVGHNKILCLWFIFPSEQVSHPMESSRNPGVQDISKIFYFGTPVVKHIKIEPTLIGPKYHTAIVLYAHILI